MGRLTWSWLPIPNYFIYIYIYNISLLIRGWWVGISIKLLLFLNVIYRDYFLLGKLNITNSILLTLISIRLVQINQFKNFKSSNLFCLQCDVAFKITNILKFNNDHLKFKITNTLKKHLTFPFFIRYNLKTLHIILKIYPSFYNET